MELPPGYKLGPCIFQAGMAMSCPSGQFTTPHFFYAQDFTPSCSPCTCDPALPTTCTVSGQATANCMGAGASLMGGTCLSTVPLAVEIDTPPACTASSILTVPPPNDQLVTTFCCVN
jgi:hypothetical protein